MLSLIASDMALAAAAYVRRFNCQAAVDEGVECRARKDVRAVPDYPARPRERDWARFKAHFEIDHRFGRVCRPDLKRLDCRQEHTSNVPRRMTAVTGPVVSHWKTSVF
jgi:hypothetical protein